MSSIFNGATALNQNIGRWNVAAVSNMRMLLQDAAAFDDECNVRTYACCISQIFGYLTLMTGFDS